MMKSNKSKKHQNRKNKGFKHDFLPVPSFIQGIKREKDPSANMSPGAGHRCRMEKCREIEIGIFEGSERLPW